MDELTLLAQGAVDGDDAALAELVRRTQDTVWAVCRMLADVDEVEDVVQEVYLRVVAALPRFRFDSPVTPWMLSIARRTCADLVRSRRRGRRLLDRLATQSQSDTSAPIGREVEDLLAGLDPEWKLAFVLTQLFGLSYEEAATVCGCPVGTIRSRVARSRAALAGAMRRADSA